jgi:predicted nucleotidyltransferase
VDIAALRRALSDALGVSVDVATEDLLRDGVREQALLEAVPL